MKPKTVIVRDSREQMPFLFHSFGEEVEIVVRCLNAGDYSIDGYESQIAIERKSIGDLYGSLTRDRERFEKEFQRLADYEFSAVVVESPWTHICNPSHYDRYWRSKASPSSIIGSILSWSIKYPTKWFLCPDRLFAERTTLRLLQHFLRIKEERNEQ